MKVHSLPGLKRVAPAARATEASCQVTEARSCSPPFMVYCSLPSVKAMVLPSRSKLVVVASLR
ncbi:hypothetical protein [Massilia sp. Se16.2.3]|uniref:hypothetical protein n=1 Tax=Massilia sp. Se16.2.3 TaxID=2709303 RepID=UPI0035A68DC5